MRCQRGKGGGPAVIEDGDGADGSARASHEVRGARRFIKVPIFFNVQDS